MFILYYVNLMVVCACWSY